VIMRGVAIAVALLGLGKVGIAQDNGDTPGGVRLITIIRTPGGPEGIVTGTVTAPPVASTSAAGRSDEPSLDLDNIRNGVIGRESRVSFPPDSITTAFGAAISEAIDALCTADVDIDAWDAADMEQFTTDMCVLSARPNAS
jgi:hypothetical protein